MARIIWSARAQRDAEEIWQYVARDNPDAADRLTLQIDEKLETCLEFPLSGRPRTELRPNLRSVSVGNYTIFYEPMDDGIFVSRVLHAARDIERIYDEEPDD